MSDREDHPPGRMARLAAEVAGYLALALLAWLLWAGSGCTRPARAAPAPFPRAAKARPLSCASLAGCWSFQWGTVSATVVLSPDGDYRCLWRGARYVGTWGVGLDGRLWLTETCRPDTSSSWASYAIRLKRSGPDSYAGPVEVGAAGVMVRMERRNRP